MELFGFACGEQERRGISICREFQHTALEQRERFLNAGEGGRGFSEVGGFQRAFERLTSEPEADVKLV